MSCQMLFLSIKLSGVRHFIGLFLWGGTGESWLKYPWHGQLGRLHATLATGGWGDWWKCQWNREGKETQQGAETGKKRKRKDVVARELGRKWWKPRDETMFQRGGEAGGGKWSLAVLCLRAATCTRIWIHNVSLHHVKWRQSAAHCTLTTASVSPPCSACHPSGPTSWCVTDRHGQLGWTQHTRGMPPTVGADEREGEGNGGGREKKCE